MSNKAFFVIGVCLIIVCGAAWVSQEVNNFQKMIDWIRPNSAEIVDFDIGSHCKPKELLDKIIGDASLVCLGESRHDSQEQFRLKKHMIKYLIEKKGFSIFILEASLPFSKQINNYIQNGSGNLEVIMSDMPGSFMWNTTEMYDILQWMRAYTLQHPDKPLSFYGIDIVAPEDGLNQVMSYIERFDLQHYLEIEDRDYARDLIDDNNWSVTRDNYSVISISRKEILKSNYQYLLDRIEMNEAFYLSLSSADEYKWIKSLAYSANKANRMFSSDYRLEMGLIRDTAMASNTISIMNWNCRNQKAVLWAHNVHICRGPFTMTGMPDTVLGMGYHLSEEFGEGLVSIAGSFVSGQLHREERFTTKDIGTIENTFSMLGFEQGLVNLKGISMNSFARNWLETNKRQRAQGFDMTFAPALSFDAFFFVDSISTTVQNNI